MKNDVPRDDRGRIEMPDHINTTSQAADVALALTEFLDDSVESDATLARLANAVQSALRARSMTTDTKSRYGARVTFVDRHGESHTAIVMEPEVANMATDEAWDPYQEEFVNPQEAYPLGTVQLIYTPDYDLSDGFNFDRKKHIEVATSVTPASGPEDIYCYYAGWDYALSDD